MKNNLALSFWLVSRSGLLAASILAMCAGPAVTQDRLSSVERSILLRMSTTDRWSDRDFQRQLYALQSARYSDRFRSLNNLQRQGANQRAMMDRARIQAALNTGRTSRARAVPRMTQQPQEEEEIDPDLIADVTVVFQNFGVVFKAADPALIRKAAPKFTDGLEVAKIRADGPVDAAGWKIGDVLLGLDKYQIQTYSDAGYVADLKDIAQINPIKTILIRDGKLITGTLDVKIAKPLDFAPFDEMQAENKSAEGAGNERPLSDPPAKKTETRVPPEPPPAKQNDLPKNSVGNRPLSSHENPSAPPMTRRTEDRVQETPPLSRGASRQIEQPPVLENSKSARSNDRPTNSSRGDSLVVQPKSGKVTTASNDIRLTDDEALWGRLGIAGEAAEGLFGDGKFKGGVRVIQVRPASPARKANWRMGDVIVSMHDYQMVRPSDISFALTEFDGTGAKEVEYTVVRDGRPLKGKLAPETAAAANPPLEGFQRVPKEK